jgi:glutamine synthetase
MFDSFEKAAEFIGLNDVQMIDLKFCDLWGKWHHVTISKNEFTPELMIHGIGFDGSSVGFKSVHSGDMALIPDLSTGFIDVFWDTPTLSFVCNTVLADTKEPYSEEPREISRKAENYLKNSGIADQSIWGPEFEFYVFSKVKYKNTMNEISFEVGSEEVNWITSGEKVDGYQNSIHQGYHVIPPNDRHFNLRSKMALNLMKMGVPVKYHHHEVGGPGQHEIETPLMGIQQAGDSSLMIKYITKMTAFQENLSVTYLPKPLFGEAGNGMHFHQQLRNQGENLFYDADSPFLLSKIALYYIGGLLLHAPALLAFTNPSTNSYRRLVPGYEAPVNSFFSTGNRSAAIRIPSYVTNPDDVRFEFRPPDATCNPYLAMAAMLMAGIDGVINKIDPTENGFGPFDEDVFSWSIEKRDKIKKLPNSLDQALNALDKDRNFLIKNNVFTDALIDRWITKKMDEFNSLQKRPHPYEYELYFDL